MDDVFVHFIPLPPGINEMVTPCLNGYTVYIDPRLDDAHQRKAYNHALYHIEHNDFERYDIEQVEREAHDKKD